MYQFNHPHIHRLERMTNSAMHELPREKTAVIATFSPLEVHGPHLPMGQDFFEGEAFAMASALKVLETHPDWHFLFLPAMPIACDTVPELGSVEFTPAQVRQIAFSSLAPFAKAGFARFAYSSFHGSPRHFLALEAAAEKLTNKFGVPAVCLFSMALSRIADPGVFHDAIAGEPDCPVTREQFKQDLHGGFMETSLALHLFPELVRDGYQALPPSYPGEGDKQMRQNSVLFARDGGDKPKLALFLERVRVLYSDIRATLEHFTRSTYRGFPAPSSSRWGGLMFEQLLSLATPLLAEFLDKGKEFDGHSHIWPMRHLFLNEPLGKAVRGYQERLAGQNAASTKK